MANYTSRPYVLAETNWRVVSESEYKVAILPWGATEAHNYHLPYATDNFQADHVAIESAKVAWESGEKTIVLPCIPFGVNTGQMDIPLCMNLNPSTQLAVLDDVATVLVEAGVEKLVILNGHGGNSFKQMIREISFSHPELFVCCVDWYRAVDPASYFDEPGNHAGELETSAMMHIAPQFVRPIEEAGSGAAKYFKIDAFGEGWAQAQRHWTKVTADTGVGNPAASTSTKGEKYLNAVCKKIGQFLIELSQSDIDDMYEA